jgi:hypothetical protein
MEGKFSSEGLQALEDDDDMLTAMARELVTQKGVGEKAAAVWRDLQIQRTSVAVEAIPASPASERAVECEGETEPSLIVVPTLERPQPQAVGLAEFAAPTRRHPRRPAPADDNQLSLF